MTKTASEKVSFINDLIENKVAEIVCAYFEKK